MQHILLGQYNVEMGDIYDGIELSKAYKLGIVLHTIHFKIFWLSNK